MARREKDKARDAVKSPVATLEEREVARRREGEQYSKRDSIT
jgi:hypothetical protein